MTVLADPDDYYPAALRKLFDDELAGPLELSTEEIKEARQWKRRLLADIYDIEANLNTKNSRSLL